MPSGAYLLLGTLNVPRFVRLHGDLMLPASLSGALPGKQAPENSPLAGGTTLGMVEGFGNADAPPFLTVNTNSVVEGLAIYDPLQTNAEDATAPNARPVGDQHRRGCRAASPTSTSSTCIRASKPGGPSASGLTTSRASRPSRASASTTAATWTGSSRSSSSPSSTTTPRCSGRGGPASGSGRWSTARPSRSAATTSSACSTRSAWATTSATISPSTPAAHRTPATGLMAALIGCGADLTEQPVYVDDVAIPGITFTDCDFVALNDSRTHYNVYTAPTFTGRLSFVNCNFWNAYGSAVMINAAPYGAAERFQPRSDLHELPVPDLGHPRERRLHPGERGRCAGDGLRLPPGRPPRPVLHPADPAVPRHRQLRRGRRERPDRAARPSRSPTTWACSTGV